MPANKLGRIITIQKMHIKMKNINTAHTTVQFTNSKRICTSQTNFLPTF